MRKVEIVKEVDLIKVDGSSSLVAQKQDLTRVGRDRSVARALSQESRDGKKDLKDIFALNCLIAKPNLTSCLK